MRDGGLEPVAPTRTTRQHSVANRKYRYLSWSANIPSCTARPRPLCLQPAPPPCLLFLGALQLLELPLEVGHGGGEPGDLTIREDQGRATALLGAQLPLAVASQRADHDVSKDRWGQGETSLPGVLPSLCSF